jgi:multidrug efflux pump subunit AcrB
MVGYSHRLAKLSICVGTRRLQPHTSLDRANSQVVAASQFVLRLLPPGIEPPEIINFSASSVPILQLGLSGNGLSEQQLNDLAQNFVRTQLITVPGAVIPLPYGGKQRQVMVNLDHSLMQARNVSRTDVLRQLAKHTDYRRLYPFIGFDLDHGD